VAQRTSGTQGSVLSSLQQRALLFAALGDPTRLAIVDLLQHSDASPEALSRQLLVPSNLLNHHLNRLEGVGIIRRIRSAHDARRIYIQLVHSALPGVVRAGSVVERPRRIAFVCTGNSARSVLAAALWRLQSRVPVVSGGTKPADRFHPGTVRIARRRALELKPTKPQRIGNILRPSDLVVTVCDAAQEELDHPADRRLHWSIPDPTHAGTSRAFTETVTELTRRIDALSGYLIQNRNASSNTLRRHDE
jgi:protein-tyrosine-phosphatase/DNA-binding transcriptional ArsR family regulator